MNEELNTAAVDNQTVDTEQVGTYTEAQVQELLQKEADKRVTAALAKQEAKYKKQQSEAEKLATMDEAQKQQYSFEQKVKELEDKQREFNLMSNKVEAQKVMSSRGLPVDFVDYIVAEDADTMMVRIETFERQFKAAVSDAISKKIGSTAPKTSTVVQTGLTKESFRKMNIAQQAQIAATNPTLYKELTTN